MLFCWSSLYGYISSIYYIKIVWFMSYICLLAFALFILPQLVNKLGVLGTSYEKGTSYECGFEPFMSSGKVLDIHFIVVAVLFLLFEFELILIFPFILGAQGHLWFNPHAVGNLFVFLFLLLLGFIYEWKRGVLDWPIFVIFK